MGSQRLRIIAFIAVRNGAEYLRRTLPHLARNGVGVVMLDNQSDDDTAAVIAEHARRGTVLAHRGLPYDGTFDLRRQLAAKASLIAESDADWVLHLDADEMPHSPRAGETLADAIARAEAAGYNALNFDEFVFLPVGGDVPAAEPYFPFAHYYFFEPASLRLMRAWRRSFGFSNVGSGGHRLHGEALAVAPWNLVLRHYPFLSQAHALRKYAGRRFAPDEVAHGWHRNRLDIDPRRLAFPPPGELHALRDVGQHALDRSRPRRNHYWEWSGR